MGQWGFYDDEGDPIADFASHVEKLVLPEKLKILKLISKRPCDPPKKGCVQVYTTEENEQAEKIQHRYMMNHKAKIQTAIRKLLKKKVGYHCDKNSEIAGIALYLARGWGSTPIFPCDEDSRVSRGYRFPTRLANDYPKLLKKMAYRASVNLYNNFKNELDWSNPEARLKALRDQIKLFSP